MADARQTGRRFYLHIGLTKSGTSYLQDVLYASTDALREQGAAMVPPRPGGNTHLALDVAGLGKPEDGDAVGQARERFDRQLAEAADVSTCIFSQEIIAPAPVEAIRDLVEQIGDREVHVVVTVRDPARTLASSWQQSVQQRGTVTLEQFYEEFEHGGPSAWWFEMAQDLPRVVRRWAEVVPAERVHVVVVPGPGADPTILRDRFFGVLGLDPGPLAVPHRPGNAAIGNLQSELLRRVNVALGDRLPRPRDGYARVGKRWLALQVLRRQAGDRPLLPASLQPRLEAMAEEWIGFLREGAHDVVGDPEELRADVRSFAESDETGFDEAALLDAAVAALADILELRDADLRRRDARAARGDAARGATVPRRIAGRVRRVVRRAAGS